MYKSQGPVHSFNSAVVLPLVTMGLLGMYLGLMYNPFVWWWQGVNRS
jgi:hypothetical protein